MWALSINRKYNQTTYTLLLSWHTSILPLNYCSSLLVGLSALPLPYAMPDRVYLLKLRKFMSLPCLKSCKDFISLSWSYSLSLCLNYLPVSPHSLCSALFSPNTPTKLRPYPNDLSIFGFTPPWTLGMEVSLTSLGSLLKFHLSK